MAGRNTVATHKRAANVLFSFMQWRPIHQRGLILRRLLQSEAGFESKETLRRNFALRATCGFLHAGARAQKNPEPRLGFFCRQVTRVHLASVGWCNPDCLAEAIGSLTVRYSLKRRVISWQRQEWRKPLQLHHSSLRTPWRFPWWTLRPSGWLQRWQMLLVLDAPSQGCQCQI